MATQIDELLDVTRRYAGDETPRLSCSSVDLVERAGRILADYQPARPSHPVRLEAPIPSLVVSVDHALLERVFDNLLSNAVTCSPEGAGTTITVWLPD